MEHCVPIQNSSRSCSRQAMDFLDLFQGVPIPSFQQLLLVSVVVGLSSHWLIFVRGELDKYAPRIAIYHSFALCLVFVAAAIVYPSWVEAATASLTASAGYLTGLFSSILLYRAIFHPLRAYPGPLPARLTAFWSMAVSAKGNKWHLKVQELHRQYGDFVRIRPREISICHPDAVQDIHGHKSTCIKGPFYDINYPNYSLQLTRDKALRSQRRKVWDRGFTEKALKSYEPRIIAHSLELISHLNSWSSGEQSVDLMFWYHFFTLDAMGDLTFGKSFNIMSEQREENTVFKQSYTIKPLLGILFTMPWTFVLFQHMPFVSGQRAKWIRWCGEQLEERRKMKKDLPDIFTYLVDDDSKRAKDPLLSQRDLVCDSELAITAGSDTVAATLTNIFFLLTTHPEELRLLQQELDPLPPIDEISHSSLKNLPVLDGIINEALRLYPPVLSGLQRMTPKEGAVIAGRFIPGDTVVATPTYVLHRDPRCFPRPDEFIPQRWSSEPELALRKDAFNPFSTGTFACVGKQLAMLELRTVVYMMVKSFDMSLADPVKGAIAFTQEPGHRDCFTMDTPSLPVLLRRRQ
ncbi:cytochrome P450 [Heliocybe sulcata]|uniref:Cytochrome P450 n=1 Tax=Heliocybe sulcata TaxID=5364 RepID=A0A5C3N4Z3_9AGAM|nr:cytochrome P450 [Heliocybe sulcata]